MIWGKYAIPTQRAPTTYRWRGALLPNTAKISFQVLELFKRPVSAAGDHYEIRDVMKSMLRRKTMSRST